MSSDPYGYPPPPMSVVPLPDPIGRPAFPGRPGTVTAIGVIGIIVAAICIFGGGLTALLNFAWASASRFQGGPPIKPAVPIAATVEYVCRDGLNAADRRSAVAAFGLAEQLTPPAVEQLDEILAENGQAMLGIGGGSASPEGIKNLITSSGRMTQPGGDVFYFALGDGRLELSDTTAVYRPSGGGPAITTRAAMIPPKMPGSVPAVLTDEQIRSVLRAITEKRGDRLKTGEVKAMVDVLVLPGQLLVVPTTDGTDPAFEITTVSSDYQTDLVVTTSHTGQEATATVPAGSSTASVNIGAAARPIPMMPLNRPAALTAGMFSAMNLAVAGFLLMASIFTLRQSRHAGWMLWVFVLLKLLAGAGVIVAGHLMWKFFADDVRPYSEQAADSISSLGMTLTVIPAIGCVFPIVLLIVLLLPGVRRYFRESRLVVG